MPRTGDPHLSEATSKNNNTFAEVLWLRKQGALAPFAASVALFAGYLVVKFFPNLNLQAFLNLYFWLIGSIAIFGALQGPLRQSVGPCLTPLD